MDDALLQHGVLSSWIYNTALPSQLHLKDTLLCSILCLSQIVSSQRIQPVTMKLVFPLAALVSLGQSLLIQRDEDSSRESVSTVYTFVGASGSASKVLQMPSSSGESSQPHETSDGKQESSALSQLLHASTGASGNSTAFQTAKVTESPSVSTSSTAKKSDNSSGTSSVSHGKAASSTESASSADGANKLYSPLVAGGVAAAVLAIL